MSIEFVYHKPVLLQESLGFLNVHRGGAYVDGTLGGGGHTEAILTADPTARVWAFDADDDAVKTASVRLAGFGTRVTVLQDNFAHWRERLYQLGVDAIDGFLLDLGVSSFQLDKSERGFSYRFDGPLDMRMGNQGGQNASDLVNGLPEKDLAEIFFKFGEERQSRRIARQIVRARQISPVRTTTELARIVAQILPERHANKTLSRIFQALRIAVNHELDNLKQALHDGIALLKPGGRVVVIAYHSLEDRIVKEIYRHEASDEIVDPNFPELRTAKAARLRVLTRRPVEPGDAEIRSNPRARSAKLRAAERI